MTFNRNEIFETARAWIKEIGSIIRLEIHEPRHVQTKTDRNDLVTEMDKKVELFFVNNIKKTYKHHQICSEEGLGDEVTSLKETTWIIDPIDGTMNFVHQKRNFAISVAVYHEHIGEIGFVYDVMNDILYSAKRGEGAYKNEEGVSLLSEDKDLQDAIIMVNTIWTTENNTVDDVLIRALVRKVRGVRTYGSAALEMCYLAEGIVDAYLSFRLNPWDVAAGAVIYQEVGGVIKSATGETVTYLRNQPLVSGHRCIVDQIVDGYVNLKL